jgi:hypothetical protein
MQYISFFPENYNYSNAPHCYLHTYIALIKGNAVAVWLKYCAGIFDWYKSFWSHYGPGVDSASNKNEYQKYLLGGGGG